MKKLKKKAATALKKSKRSNRREEEVRKKGAVSRHRTNKMTDALHQVGIRHKCLSLSAAHTHTHTTHTVTHTHTIDRMPTVATIAFHAFKHTHNSCQK